MQTKYVTWQDIDKFVDDVAELAEDCQLSGVYGVPRGGMVLAVMLSYKLGVPLLSAPDSDGISVDSIASSSNSLMHASKIGSKTVTFAYSEGNEVELDFKGQWRPNDIWLAFPWEAN